MHHNDIYEPQVGLDQKAQTGRPCLRAKKINYASTGNHVP